MYSIVHVQNRTRWRWRDRLFLNCCRTKFIIFHFNLFCFVWLYNNNRSSCPALEKGHRSWYSMPMKGELTSWVIDVPPHFLHTHLSTGNLPSPHAHAQCQGPVKFTSDFWVNFCFCAKVLTRHFCVKVLPRHAIWRQIKSFFLSKLLFRKFAVVALRMQMQQRRGRQQQQKPL